MNLIPATTIARLASKLAGPVASQIVNVVHDLAALPASQQLAVAKRLALTTSSALAVERSLAASLNKLAPKKT
jgi:hypothetical protein